MMTKYFDLHFKIYIYLLILYHLSCFCLVPCGILYCTFPSTAMLRREFLERSVVWLMHVLLDILVFGHT